MRHSLPLTLLVLGTALPAAAQTGHTPSTSEVYACAEIEAGDARLACYDDAVGRLKSAEEAGDVLAVTREDIEQVKKESFGFPIPSLPDFASSMFGGEEMDRLTLPVSSVGKARNGGFIVTLENGQVWCQTDSKQVYYSAKRGVDNATVKSAAFGSYMMKFDDGVLFRVERVK